MKVENKEVICTQYKICKNPHCCHNKIHKYNDKDNCFVGSCSNIEMTVHCDIKGVRKIKLEKLK